MAQLSGNPTARLPTLPSLWVLRVATFAAMSVVMATELGATVSSKGQVVIPADVRRRLGLVQGSVVRYVAQDDPSQSAAATRLIEEAISPAEPASVSLVALLVSMAAERGATAVTFDAKAARRLGMRLLK